MSVREELPSILYPPNKCIDAEFEDLTVAAGPVAGGCGHAAPAPPPDPAQAPAEPITANFQNRFSNLQISKFIQMKEQ